MKRLLVLAISCFFAAPLFAQTQTEITTTATSSSNSSNVNQNTNLNTTNYTGTSVNQNTNTSTIDTTAVNTNVNSMDYNGVIQNINNNTSTSNNVNVNNNTNVSTSNTNNVNQNTTTSNTTSFSESLSTTNSVSDINALNQNVNTSTSQSQTESTQRITQKLESPPPSAIAAPIGSSYSQDLCTTGRSLGLQSQILGIATGRSVRDINCERIKLGKTLYDMGMRVAAVSLMCQDYRVWSSMMAAGTPCPYEGKIGDEAKELWEANPDKIPERDRRVR